MIDGAVTAAAATSEMVATIARAGPFGAGNPEPMIALPAHTLVYAEEVGQAHMRARLRAGDGIDHRRHRISRGRPETGDGARAEPRPVRACRRHFVPRPLERRRTGAIAADRYGAG